jgi:hypothetical protein
MLFKLQNSMASGPASATMPQRRFRPLNGAERFGLLSLGAVAAGAVLAFLT